MQIYNNILKQQSRQVLSTADIEFNRLANTLLRSGSLKFGLQLNELNSAQCGSRSIWQCNVKVNFVIHNVVKGYCTLCVIKFTLNSIWEAAIFLRKYYTVLQLQLEGFRVWSNYALSISVLSRSTVIAS